VLYGCTLNKESRKETYHKNLVINFEKEIL